ncbi:hypothetical protein A9Q89_03755 [Gammaproteobacteria bacterium 53_120_T64]|nr:hypothetical protein A9Q89_03755 [Gammaproteobacteria bacterium 53_120_T64]
MNRQRLALWILTTVLAYTGQYVSASTTQESWNPVASERLITLPSAYIEQAVERDFSVSPLGNELKGLDQQLEVKAAELTSLKQTVPETEGDAKLDARFQLVTEKSGYVDLMKQQLKLRRSAQQKRSQLYQQILHKQQQGRRMLYEQPQAQQLLTQQHAAQQRLQRTLAMVDEVSDGFEQEGSTAYQNAYRDNLGEMKALQRAIQQHSLNLESSIDGHPLTRENFLRQLILQSQTELALIEQEEQMLALMAQLVSLDAEALEHELSLGQLNGTKEGIVAARRYAPAIITELFID